MSSDQTRLSQPAMLKLGEVKYLEWEKLIFGRLMSLNVVGIVLGTEYAVPEPDPGASTETIVAWNTYQGRVYKAAGEIYQWLDAANKAHVHNNRTDPKLMWETLRKIHSKSAPNSRFTSLTEMFAIRLKDGESLMDLAGRVDAAMQNVKVLRPIVGYTLDKLDEELAVMAMIRALPHDSLSSYIYT